MLPKQQCQGYDQLIDELNQWLCAITGMDYFSFQPNSGAQGELTGLLVAQFYHQSQGESQRDMVFIPHSCTWNQFRKCHHDWKQNCCYSLQS